MKSLQKIDFDPANSQQSLVGPEMVVLYTGLGDVLRIRDAIGGLWLRIILDIYAQQLLMTCSSGLVI